MKKIVVIFTGGTISMSESVDGLVIPSNKGDELIKFVSKIETKFEISIFDFDFIPSPSMSFVKLSELGDLVSECISDSNVDGVVITHGTDTMEETAYFLNLFCNVKKPVVLTGSMRNSTDLGFDGPSNLSAAVHVASSNNSIGLGVLLVMNDEINNSVEVTKTHTFMLDTFKSLEYGPLGSVDNDRVVFYRKPTDNEQLYPTIDPSVRVQLLKLCLDIDETIFDFFLQTNVDGIVLEAFGRGNVPPKIVPYIEKCIQKSIPVVLVSRCPKGTVLDTYGYEGGGKHLTSLGVIFGGYLSGQKARIKLSLALSKYKNDYKAIRDCF